MENLSRRTFAKDTLRGLLTFSLLETLFECDALADKVEPVIVRWLNDINQLGFDLKEKKLAQVDWQKKVEELFSRVELSELLTLIDFQRVTRNLKLKDNGARSLRFDFRQLEGVPEKLAYGKQIFALKKGRSVVPHGHNNMATAFLILKGRFHGRHYDRVQDEKDHLIIRPTIDDKFGPGGCTTVSDYKDNVHWFQSESEPAFIFNIHVLGVGEGVKRTGRVYVDPFGEKLKGGLIRAKRLNDDQAHEMYG